MSASPSPSSVLAQCTICGWQGWIEPKEFLYQVVGVTPRFDSAYLNNSCRQCGAMKLIDRSTQAPSHA